MRLAIRLLALLSALCFLGGTVQAQPPSRSVEYCLTHIWTPRPDHFIDFHITDMNDKGELVGYGDGPHASHGAFLWRRGEFIDLGTQIGHAETFAFGINDHGDVVGAYSDGGEESQAFLLRHGRVIDIQVPGVGSTSASAINNKRQVLVSRDEPRDAFIWKRGSAALLEPLEQGGLAIPSSMNDRGIIAGESVTPDGSASRMVLWQDGTVMDLGLPEGAFAAGAVGINNRGQVAVNAVVPPYSTRPFIWQEGEMIELPLISDIRNDTLDALLRGINDQGVAVGVIETFTTQPIPTVWRAGQATDLNTLICSDDPARSQVHLEGPASLINNRGQIVATGFDLRFGPGSYFLLTPKR